MRYLGMGVQVGLKYDGASSTLLTYENGTLNAAAPGRRERDWPAVSWVYRFGQRALKELKKLGKQAQREIIDYRLSRAQKRVVDQFLVIVLKQTL
jgi:hypothetical protein